MLMRSRRKYESGGHLTHPPAISKRSDCFYHRTLLGAILANNWRPLITQSSWIFERRGRGENVTNQGHFIGQNNRSKALLRIRAVKNTELAAFSCNETVSNKHEVGDTSKKRYKRPSFSHSGAQIAHHAMLIGGM